MIDRNALAALSTDEAFQTALNTASSDSDRAYIEYLRGRLAWKEGRRADALTFYNTAITLDPNSEASIALNQAQEIMDFYNKDLYNP